MKNIYSFLLLCFAAFQLNAQAPFTRVYTILSTKCQNSSCHSASATDGSQALPFDGGSEAAVWNAIYNVTPANASSVAKYEKLVKSQQPYSSFLLRKIAGASFDTDLALDASEGALMNDINGQQLSSKEIEFVRQWIMFGAKKSYSSSDPKPDWTLISSYYDNATMPFLTKPPKPAPGTGIQLRMGPVFIPSSGSNSEQEWLEQHEVNFPYPVEIDRIAGYMNQQSHHFLLFKFTDTTAASQAASDRNGDMERISILTGNTSFDGDKLLTGGWQDDAELILPTGTAMFWDQKTILDMNYHAKNYSTTDVLPCDFYFNIYYKPRNPNTIEMKTALVNNPLLFLPGNMTSTRDYDDQNNHNSFPETRYVWNMTSHSHKYGVDYDIYIRDTTGAIANQVYEGFDDYAHGGIDLGYYSWDHPSTETFPNFLPVPYGKHNGNSSGLVARTTWDVTQSLPVTFGFTTSDEMQLFYYNYVTELPAQVSSVKDNAKESVFFQVVPNPMNNNGKLVYSLDKAANVNASILDVTGKVVTALKEGSENEGVHEITIGNGNLSKGIYFARLSVNGTVYTKKFIVTE
jgi:hypothetical protein